MVSPARGKGPAPGKKGAETPSTAQQHEAEGTPPSGENARGKIVNKTAKASKGEPSNPKKPDISKTHEYLDSVKPEEIRGESIKLIDEWKRAREAGDYVRADEAKTALAGLKDKANAAGMGAKDVPELADTGTLIGILEAVLPMGGRRPGNNPKVKSDPKLGAGSGGGFAVKRTRKPLQPNKEKWKKKGGTVRENSDGSTTYTTKDGTSVTYNKEGYPDFKPHTQVEVKVEGLSGKYGADERLANKAVGLNETPPGYVWHHVEDGKTMQLIPRDIHQTFPHTGGAAIIRNGI